MRTPVMFGLSMARIFGIPDVVVAHEDGGAAARDRVDDEAAVGLRDAVEDGAAHAAAHPERDLGADDRIAPVGDDAGEARGRLETQHDLAGRSTGFDVDVDDLARRQPLGEGAHALSSGGEAGDGELALPVGDDGGGRGKRWNMSSAEWTRTLAPGTGALVSARTTRPTTVASGVSA